jgi:hypothetical protein
MACQFCHYDEPGFIRRQLSSLSKKYPNSRISWIEQKYNAVADYLVLRKWAKRNRNMIAWAVNGHRLTPPMHIHEIGSLPPLNSILDLPPQPEATPVPASGLQNLKRIVEEDVAISRRESVPVVTDKPKKRTKKSYKPKRSRK